MAALDVNADDDSDVPEDAPLQIPEALRNILMLLQKNPERYRCFGIFWWPVKALLKASGYTRENLFLLGDYVDREVAEMVPQAGLEQTLRWALEEFGYNLSYPHSDGRTENTDLELVQIIDQDAGGL